MKVLSLLLSFMLFQTRMNPTSFMSSHGYTKESKDGYQDGLFHTQLLA